MTGKSQDNCGASTVEMAFVPETTVNSIRLEMPDASEVEVF